MSPKEYKKYSKNFKYFMNTYMFTDSNSESLSFLMWLIIFKPNTSIGFVTNYMENGNQLINTIFRYIDSFPKDIRPESKKRTISGFSLSNNVNFYVISHYNQTLGKSLSYLFIDDFESFNKLKNHLIPTLLPSVKIENINKHIVYLL